MCNYQNGTMECRGDGFLWDADADGYDPDEQDHPCPSCNTQTFLERAQEDAESVSSGSAQGYHYTGVSLWQEAVKHARAENSVATDDALVQIGVVRALFDDDQHPDGHGTSCFVYVR